jgi:hypothetical protein
MMRNKDGKLEQSFALINFHTHEDLAAFESEFDKAIK